MITEFHGTYYCHVLFNISVVYRRDGWDGLCRGMGWDGMGWEVAKPPARTPLEHLRTHTMVQ